MKIVTLKFQCPLKVQDLKQVGAQYHCTSCHKKIHDFRNETSPDFQNLSKSGSTCGMFRKSQLHPDFLKYASAGLLAAQLLTVSTGCEPTANQTEVEPIPETSETELEEILMGDIFISDLDLVKYTHAEPPVSYADFMHQLAAQLRFPDQSDVAGKVYCKLEIDSKGELTDVKVMKGINEVYNQEAIRAIKALNYTYKPARENDVPVEGNIIVPVVFKLNK